MRQNRRPSSEGSASPHRPPSERKPWFLERRADWESAAAEKRGEAKKTQEELSVCRKQLEDLKPWSEMSGESLTSLTTQQRLIVVEEAGIKARIALCEKILNEGKVEIRRIRWGQPKAPVASKGK